ncbi:MCE family protein [Mumia sp. Pv 4-285]|uniref:MCE family protein n=1 Tax=Mumia qirimensis TaxID=3234852 RepID=UPI00351CFD4A
MRGVWSRSTPSPRPAVVHAKRSPADRGAKRSRSLIVLAAAGVLTLSGCGALSGGVYEAPLPGGADVGSDPMTITADFEDVLDLVPQSSVKVDNVDVGRVSKIELNPDGKSAKVELVVNGATALPAGTTARLQQTSLLGEKYVALVRPAKPAAGTPVSDGDAIPLASTSQAAQVEQVLGALSMVLNGGGIGQFQEISRELQQVSDGRPEEIKAFLQEMNTFVTALDKRKGAITDAIDGLAALSTTLNADKDKIANALDDLSPGMEVLVDQREDLVAMLQSLDKLSEVTVDTLDKAQEDIVADFKLLEPILTQLAKAGSDLPNSLEILLTYPFPDSVLGAIKGDYLNVFVTTNFRTLPSGCTTTSCPWPQVGAASGVGVPGGLLGAPTPAEGQPDERGVPEAPPTLLPPTSSPTPGAPQQTIPVPATPSPSDAPTSSPTDPPTSPAPSTDPAPTPNDPSPTSDDSAAPKEGDD